MRQLPTKEFTALTAVRRIMRNNISGKIHIPACTGNIHHDSPIYARMTPELVFYFRQLYSMPTYLYLEIHPAQKLNSAVFLPAG